MKRGWFGAGILAVFLVLGIGIRMAMDNAHLPTCKLLTDAAESTLSGNFAQGVRLAEEAKQRWERQWNGTALVADHSPMDEVDALFSEMDIYAKTGEEPHFAACCLELSQRVQAFADAHRFSWWNVL